MNCDPPTQAFSAGLNKLQRELALYLDIMRESAALKCESPIEVKMVEAIMVSDLVGLHTWPVIGQDEGVFVGPCLGIYLQRRIGPYRPDIAIIYAPERDIYLRVIVECDGHEFHEKNKEQAARDKSRDRFLLGRGWPVLRFTGSEIHRDAAKCAQEVRDCLLSQWHSGVGRVEDPQVLFK